MSLGGIDPAAVLRAADARVKLREFRQARKKLDAMMEQYKLYELAKMEKMKSDNDSKQANGLRPHNSWNQLAEQAWTDYDRWCKPIRLEPSKHHHHKDHRKHHHQHRKHHHKAEQYESNVAIYGVAVRSDRVAPKHTNRATTVVSTFEDICGRIQAEYPTHLDWVSAAADSITDLQERDWLVSQIEMDGIVPADSSRSRELSENSKKLQTTRLAEPVVDALQDLGRWWPVHQMGSQNQQDLFPSGENTNHELDVTAYAWINPSEFLGGLIFPKDGGFAYRHKKEDHSMFFALGDARPPTKYDARLHIPGIVVQTQLQLDGDDLHMHKFHHGDPAQFADRRKSALGLGSLLHNSEKRCKKLAEREEGGAWPINDLERIKKEVELAVQHRARTGNRDHDYASQEDIDNVRYVIDEKAREGYCEGNDGQGQKRKRDTGHNGWNLERFCKEPEAQFAELTIAEVAALRLYTTSTFRLINYPLRTQETNTFNAEASEPTIPLPVTTHLINEGLKKLRTWHMQVETDEKGRQKQFKPRYLWRGLKNKDVDEGFLRVGGAEH
eukprot:COSAG02_NODE_8371_length_2596_cov_1.098919_2_plen_554_part_01